MASAAGKHYIVCLVGGGTEQCTKPLTKDTAQAVYDVLLLAPIGGLDTVYIGDVKALKKQKAPNVNPGFTNPEVPKPATEPDVKL